MVKVSAWLPVVAFVLSVPSMGQAATVTNTWVFDFTTCSSNCGFKTGSGTVNNTRTFYSDAVGGQTKMVTATALFVDGIANPTYVSLGSNSNGKSTALANAVKAGELKASTGATKAGLAVYNETSGLGIGNPIDTPRSGGLESSSGGQHAIDNFDRNNDGGLNYNSWRTNGTHAADFLLLDFGEVMELHSFQLGWTGYSNTDVDFFIGTELPFDGFTNTDGTGNGTTIASLLEQAMGWKQVSKTGLGVGTKSFAGNEKYSGRYVLVAGALGGYNDAFKLDKMSMTTTSTPTPGTMALLGIGMAAVAWSRRDKRRSSTAAA